MCDQISPRSQQQLNLYIIDGGITDSNRDRLLASWPSRFLSVHWLKADTELLAGLNVAGHVSLATYFRMLIPELLPQNIDRVVYLDADVMIRSDISQLYNQSFCDACCLAVRDSAAPFVDSQVACRGATRGCL